MKRLAAVIFALCILPALIAHAAEPAQAAKPTAGLTQAARKYLVEKYFKGVDVNDKSLDEACEILRLPKSVADDISRLEWEKGQLDRFGTPKLFFLARCPDGKTRAICFRNDERRNDRILDDARVRILKRLYSDAAFNAKVAPELERWLDISQFNSVDVLTALLAKMTKAKLSVDGDTLDRFTKNLSREGVPRIELSRSLSALAECENAGELCQAAIWLVSRLDAMSFTREDRKSGIADLDAMDARTLFENVFYAVKARSEFPWGKQVSEADFFQHVLSPRGTGEPLQRWRRHFYEALAPELKDVKDAKAAINLAVTVCYDFFQYEGDTTWEDFGMLSALAVHEGRCEDCSNVENCLLRSIGLPACQAFTPYWGHGDGNHAWTEIPGLRDVSGDGANGVKLYIKNWDGLVDVTEQYTPVTRLEVATEGKGKASLNVFNDGEWRVVARAEIKEGKAAFEKVGCRRNFALVVRVEGEKDRLFDVRTDKTVRELNGAAPEEGRFECKFDKQSPLGEFKPDKDCKVEIWTPEGFKEVESERVSTGALKFSAHPDCMYRLAGEGMSNRLFTVELKDGAVVTLVR